MRLGEAREREGEREGKKGKEVRLGEAKEREDERGVARVGGMTPSMGCSSFSGWLLWL